jgi:4-hydroxybenzoate polyprenyltransferase
MLRDLHIYRIINILSLDIAAGAMICASFFARIIHVTILPQGLASLGLTVWIIYTADHLLDAKKLKQDASTERHRFHQRHFRLLFLLLLVAVFVDVAEIYFIRSIVFLTGLALSFLVVIYFLVQQKIGFLKEFLGAILYTGGILLIPLSVNNQISVSVILLILQFGITAWINLLLFSLIDQHKDETDRHHSFTTTFGLRLTRTILLFLFGAIVVLTVVQLALFSFEVKATLILALMTLLLLLIFIKQDYFEKNDRYRLLGDAVFLLPLIYILF